MLLPTLLFMPRAPTLRCRSTHILLEAAGESYKIIEDDEATFAERYDGRLPSWLINRASTLGFTTPTAVQGDALDAVLDGHDAIVQAQTGSGKTLSYMLPLLALLEPKKSVQALVLLPTRELASQVALVARRLAAGSPDRFLVMALLDGSGAKRQRKWLRAEPPQVVIGNVEQVDAVLRARLLRLETLRFLVVDEVDACLADEATSSMLQRMLGGQLAIPLAQQQQELKARGASSAVAQRQTLFVSATLPQRQHFRKQCEQQRWCREAPVLIHTEPEHVLPAQLRHGWAPCAKQKRVAALRVLLRRHEPELTGAIVFLKPGMPFQRIADALAGIIDDQAPALLTETQSLNARAEAVRGLRERSQRLLLATPLGARGLDIPHCSHVYLVGLPDSAEAYTHAAGRCGRMGQPGLVTVLAAEKEEFALQRLANALQVSFFDARDGN